ncbi:hypothetical protein EMIT043CA1_70073 [Pseudomonas brassicacearum]
MCYAKGLLDSEQKLEMRGLCQYPKFVSP